MGLAFFKLVEQTVQFFMFGNKVGFSHDFPYVDFLFGGDSPEKKVFYIENADGVIDVPAESPVCA